MRTLTAKYVVQNDWMMGSPEKKNSILDLTSTFACAHPIAFFMKNILGAFEISGVWPF